MNELITLQKELAAAVIVEDQLSRLQHIGGMDVSASRFDPEKMVFATCVILEANSLAVVEDRAYSHVQPLPYIPGLLGFREAPSLVEAYQKLTIKPDLIMVDGQGICHPRGLGLASHIGVLLDIPTIGVAKTIYIGKPAQELGYKAGSVQPLIWKDKLVGMLVRTKDGCSPLVVSPGHKISFKTSVELVLACVRGYRLPEPTRQAHLAANAARKLLPVS